MNILEAFEETIFLLPKDYSNDTFPAFLQKIYHSFLNTIDRVDKGTITDKIKDNRTKIESFCDKLIQSVNTYYLGFPAKAYFEFEDAMSLIDEFLFPPKAGQVAKDIHEPYYRARKDDGFNSLERKDMFHIPFEKREYVTTQRFSVPGLPCLYLSNSVYVCWEELGRPDINKMKVSRLKLENYRLKYLDLSLSPSFLKRMLTVSTSEHFLEGKKTSEQALNEQDYLTLIYIMRWPLIAACSIKVKKQDGAFKPEYIFPQFLLQWVRQNKNIDGIKYFSVRTNISSEHDLSKFANYAFPVKETKSNGLCENLAQSFSITEPVSWEMLTLANPDIVLHDKEKFAKAATKLGFDNMGAYLELVKGKETIYWRTIFGKIEIEMADIPLEIISSD
jgi:hypothetical protein